MFSLDMALSSVCTVYNENTNIISLLLKGWLHEITVQSFTSSIQLSFLDKRQYVWISSCWGVKNCLYYVFSERLGHCKSKQWLAQLTFNLKYVFRVEWKWAGDQTKRPRCNLCGMPHSRSTRHGTDVLFQGPKRACERPEMTWDMWRNKQCRLK